MPGPEAAWSWGVSAPGGVSALGVCAWSKGVSAPGGVPGPGGGGIPACIEADSPVDRMTDRCKNITFATSLRTVIK